MFTLGRLVAASGGRIVRGDNADERIFSGGAIDSRLVQGGEVFFALRDQRDGHEFVGDAFARGAAAAVVERIPEAPANAILVLVPSVPLALRTLAERLRDDHPIPIVGITGSVGKTTAKEATAAALGARYRVLRSAASFNNELGVPLTLLGLEASHHAAVIELGFYVPGEIADLCRLVRPRVGVITAIPDVPPHFSRTPSVAAIAAGKAELIESLPSDGVALLNADDPRVRGLAGRTTARVLLFGESPDAAVRATDVAVDGLAGVSFTVRIDGKTARAQLPLPGRHFVSIGLAALGAASVLGVPLEEAATCLATLELPPHRMAVRRGERVTIIDDTYNASPSATKAALAVLAATPTRRVAVLGDMLELGALSIEAHDAIGREAARSADLLVGIGELAGMIVVAAKREGMTLAYRAADGGEALVLLRRLLRPGDTVLVKGSRALALDQLADALVAGAI